jgi:flagellar protein FliO/FliZ
VLALALVPVVVQGAEGQLAVGSSGFLPSFLQMLAALFLVVGLILLTYYVATRLMRKIPALRPGSQHIRVLEVRAMGPRKALVLIEIGGEYLLLSSTGEHLALIKQISMLEEIELVDEPTDRSSFLSVLKRAVSRT